MRAAQTRGDHGGNITVIKTATLKNVVPAGTWSFALTRNIGFWIFRMAKRATALAVAPTQSRHADTMTDQFSDLGNT